MTVSSIARARSASILCVLACAAATAGAQAPANPTNTSPEPGPAASEAAAMPPEAVTSPVRSGELQPIGTRGTRLRVSFPAPGTPQAAPAAAAAKEQAPVAAAPATPAAPAEASAASEAPKIAVPADEKQRRDAVASDVDRVLQRAKADYPVLDTPEGEPVLRAILARQQVLAAKGVYPGIAMVEAVADHASVLAPKPAVAAEVETINPALVHLGPQPGFGGCYWKSPTLWACP